jgi:hypothetical protein
MKMNKIILSLIISMIVTGGITAQNCMAQDQTDQPPPVPQVSLALKDSLAPDKLVYLLDDPVKIVLTLQNNGEDIITSKGFMDKPFQLLLTFTGPDGKTILANDLGSSLHPEPPPPLVIPLDTNDDGVAELVQVEPVETIANGWLLTVTLPDAHAYYTLSKAGNYSVKAVIPIRTYPDIDYNEGGVDYSELNSSPPDWPKVVESNTVNFSLITDADGDGYYYPEDYRKGTNGQYIPPDCDDSNPAVHPGATPGTPYSGIDYDCDPSTPDGAGSPKGTIVVQADKHTVGGGSHPVTTKAPISALPVKILDKSPNSCVAKYGVNWQNYQDEWFNCPSVASGATDTTGKATFLVAPGDYIVVGEYNPDKMPNTGDELYIGGSIGTVAANQTAQRYVQVIAKADGKNVPAKYTVLTGTQLLVIEPEYVEWSGTQELYPFVFESVGDWGIVTSIAPPEGFVADYQSLSTEVDSEIDALQFTVVDEGSKWVDTEVEYKIKHKGKTQIIKSKIGVKKKGNKRD